MVAEVCSLLRHLLSTDPLISFRPCTSMGGILYTGNVHADDTAVRSASQPKPLETKAPTGGKSVGCKCYLS